MVLFEVGKQVQQKLAGPRTVSPTIAGLIGCQVVRGDQGILKYLLIKTAFKMFVAYSFIHLFINFC